MATIVDTHVLGQVIAAAFVAGIVIPAIFGLVIYGGTRFADLRRSGNAVGAAVYGVLAVVGLLAFAGTVVYGIVVMASK